MNIEQVVKLARDAGINEQRAYTPVMQSFAELVAAKEREECAKQCEALFPGVIYPPAARNAARQCADAIRARSEK